MGNILDWNSNRNMWIHVLKKQSGQELAYWNQRVRQENFQDENGLRDWLTEQGVTGYAATLLVMERFGYPHWISASADELVEGQYSDRPICVLSMRQSSMLWQNLANLPSRRAKRMFRS